MRLLNTLLPYGPFGVLILLTAAPFLVVWADADPSAATSEPAEVQLLKAATD